VFADFADSFSSSSAQRELFEPLSRYERICREKVDVLQCLVLRSVPTHSRSVDLHACDSVVMDLTCFIVVVSKQQ